VKKNCFFFFGEAFFLLLAPLNFPMGNGFAGLTGDKPFNG